MSLIDTEAVVGKTRVALVLKRLLLCIENMSLSISEISDLTYGVISVKGLLLKNAMMYNLLK